MAHITTLPDFYDSASPAAADFNNAGKAILDQLGGEYYDEGSGTYVQAVGNLNGQNLGSFVGFRNPQKAEPNSVYSIVLQWELDTALAISTWPISAPIAVNSTLISVGFMADPKPGGFSIYPSLGGSFTLYVNGSAVSVSRLNTSPQSDTTNIIPVTVPIGFQVAIGDVIYLDPTDISFISTGSPNMGGTFVANVYLKAAHVR